MALPPLPTVSSSSDTFSSVVNLSGNVIASVSPQKLTKDVTGERVLPLASSPVTTSPLVKTVLTANLDRGVADDKQGTVYLRGVDSRYNMKRYEGDDGDDEDGEYDDDQDYYELKSRKSKAKTDRMRKRVPRGYTKRACVYGNYGLGFGIRFRC